MPDTKRKPNVLYLDSRNLPHALPLKGCDSTLYVRGDLVETLNERIRALETLLADCRSRSKP